MTCIAAVIDNGRVHMAADRLCAYGFSSWPMTQSKVFTNGPFVIGCAGRSRLGQILKFNLNLRDDPRDDAMQFMVVQFADAVRKLLKESDLIEKHNDEPEIAGGSLAMVGFRGRVFTLTHDFCISEIDRPYHAIGCGNSLAVGSLYETESIDMTPTQRLRSAVRCAAEHSIGVAGKIDVISSKQTTK